MITSRTFDGWGESDDERHAEGEHELLEGQERSGTACRSTLSASRPPTIGRSSVGPSWAKMMTPTKVARVGEVVGVGTEDHVLHPGADVGGEGAEEDDAEGPVGQGGPGGAPAGWERGVPVDDGVLDLLDRDGGFVGVPLVWLPRHGPIVGERVPGRSWSGPGGGAHAPARDGDGGGRRGRHGGHRPAPVLRSTW